jgi:hypothetical protein
MNTDITACVKKACLEATLHCVREGRAYSPLFFRRLSRDPESSWQSMGFQAGVPSLFQSRSPTQLNP